MKKLIYLIFLTIISVSAKAQQQGLDTSFGASGISMITDSLLNMQNNCMALQPDGKIVVAGTYYYYLPNFDLVYKEVIVRFNPDGTRDNSFNQTAKEIDLNAKMSSVLIQPDNRIVITTTNYIERYLPNGKPDSSFNDSARFVPTVLGPYDAIYRASLQADGKIVFGGRIFQSNALLFRLKANGTPDSSFGYNGLVNTTLDSVESVSGFALAIQPDGKILLGGSVVTMESGSYNSYGTVIRYLSDGSLDPTFNNGKAYTKISFINQNGGNCYFLGLQAGGKIVAGGTVYYNTGSTFYKTHTSIARLTADGIIDSSFGINGRVTDDTVYNGISTYWFYPHMSMQSDGKILMAISEGGAAGGLRFALHRFNANGFIDVNFGTQGKVLTDITAFDDMPNDVLVQPDGKIVVCGIANVTNAWPQSATSNPVAVRYEHNGHLSVQDIPGDIQNAAVFPNPAGSSFTLKYELAKDDVLDIRLTDIMGRTVQSFVQHAARSKGAHTERLALFPLSAGNYFVVINGRAGMKTIKLVCE